MNGAGKYRGFGYNRRTHPVYVLRQVRFPLSPTRGWQAFKRTIEMRRPQTMGGWDDKTGDGEAWMSRSPRDHVDAFYKREIKAGRWAGPWKLAKD